MGWTFYNTSGEALINDGGMGSSAEATQAQMEAETSGVIFVPPDLMKHSPGVAKAWGVIAAAGTLQAGSHNIASIGDTGTGNRDVNWTTAFSNANFTVSGCIASTGASVNHMLVGARTTADVNVFTRDAENGNLDDEEQSVIAFGDQ